MSEVPVRWLLNALQPRGVPMEDILGILDCGKSDLCAPDLVTTVEKYTRLFEWAARHLDKPGLGLQLAYEAKPSEFGVFGYLLDNATSIAELFDLIDGYHSVFTSSFGLSYRRKKDLCIIHYEEEQVLGLENRQDIDFTTASLVRMVCDKSGKGVRPKYCKFTFEQPKDLRQHELIFGKELAFEEANNIIAFDCEILGYEVEGADPTLQTILRKQADLILQETSLDVSLSKRIRLKIAAQLGVTPVSADSMAFELHLSVRSLHRKLAQEGVSFRDLRKDVVHNAARFALRRSTASVTEIAGQLGYSETSAFDRAFKRQEGVSPSRYREAAIS